jgi:putative PIN family toxin of toxin-antitoxin system
MAGDMRLVLDTDVVVAAMRSPKGGAAELLRRIRRGRATILASVPPFIEYEAVATRAEHIVDAGASRADVENFLDVLATLIEPVEPHFLWRARLRDANAEMVLEAAVNGRADAIVTFNARDYRPAVEQFGVELLTPGEALKRL